jgi:hypothetical protein
MISMSAAYPLHSHPPLLSFGLIWVTATCAASSKREGVDTSSLIREWSGALNSTTTRVSLAPLSPSDR